MLNKTKKRKYEKLLEAGLKPLKEGNLEKPSKKAPHLHSKVNKIEEEEESKIDEKKASDSEKYDTEFEDDFDDEYGI